MIKIFENTEAVLLKSLTQFHRMAPNLRCIHLRLSRNGKQYFNETEILKLAVITEEIFDEKSSYFFHCQDGDVFIVSPHISPKRYKGFLSHLVANLRLASYEKLASLFELGHDGAKLIKIAEAKLEKIKAAGEKQNNSSPQLHVKPKIDFSDFTSTIPSSISKKRAGRIIKKVLVIEDDPFTRKLVASALGSKVDVTFAVDGSEGIRKYVRNAPDILLLDIGLPDMNGYEVMDRIKKLDPNAHIIMLTALKEAHEILYSLHQGASGYVSKPFSKAKLWQHMETSRNTINRLQTQGV